MPLTMSCSEIEITDDTSVVGFAILYRRQHASGKNCACRQSQCRDSTGSFCWLMINEITAISRRGSLNEHDTASRLSGWSEVHGDGRRVAEIPDIHAPNGSARKIHGLGAVDGL